MALDKVTAMAILESLEMGVPNQEHVLEYTAPSRLERSPLREICHHLEKVRQGLSMIRFINGAYGEGKSHTLALLRKIALQKGFVVSSFPLEAQGVRFDRFEAVLAKIIEVLGSQEFPRQTGNLCVLDMIVQKWATGVSDIDKALEDMQLDPTVPDLRAALSLYGKILRDEEPRHVDGKDRLRLLHHWFMPGPKGLPSADRNKIDVLNNITPANARQMIEGLAVFFRKLGHAGWVVLIDEQEIVPTLMTPTQRGKCNENLRLLLDAANQTRPYKGIYYLFASAPEFFADRERGVNAYPALRDRIANAVLTLPTMEEEEMHEVAEKLLHVFAAAEPGPDYGAVLTESVLSRFVDRLEERFGTVRYKARGLVKSLVAFVRSRIANPDSPLEPTIDDVLGRIFSAIDMQIGAAQSR